MNSSNKKNSKVRFTKNQQYASAIQRVNLMHERATNKQDGGKSGSDIKKHISLREIKSIHALYDGTLDPKGLEALSDPEPFNFIT